MDNNYTFTEEAWSQRLESEGIPWISQSDFAEWCEANENLWPEMDRLQAYGCHEHAHRMRDEDETREALIEAEEREQDYREALEQEQARKAVLEAELAEEEAAEAARRERWAKSNPFDDRPEDDDEDEGGVD